MATIIAMNTDTTLFIDTIMEPWPGTAMYALTLTPWTKLEDSFPKLTFMHTVTYRSYFWLFILIWPITYTTNQYSMDVSPKISKYTRDDKTSNFLWHTEHKANAEGQFYTKHDKLVWSIHDFISKASTAYRISLLFMKWIRPTFNK